MNYNTFIGGVHLVRCPKCGTEYAESTKTGGRDCPNCGFSVYGEQLDRIMKEITKAGSPLLTKVGGNELLYLVSANEAYYPWVVECKTYEEAMRVFEEEEMGIENGAHLYISKVIKMKIGDGR